MRCVFLSVEREQRRIYANEKISVDGITTQNLEGF
jgi:hypothetical protein